MCQNSDCAALDPGVLDNYHAKIKVPRGKLDFLDLQEMLPTVQLETISFYVRWSIALKINF